MLKINATEFFLGRPTWTDKGITFTPISDYIREYIKATVKLNGRDPLEFDTEKIIQEFNTELEQMMPDEWELSGNSIIIHDTYLTLDDIKRMAKEFRNEFQTMLTYDLPALIFNGPHNTNPRYAAQ